MGYNSWQVAGATAVKSQRKVELGRRSKILITSGQDTCMARGITGQADTYSLLLANLHSPTRTHPAVESAESLCFAWRPEPLAADTR